MATTAVSFSDLKAAAAASATDVATARAALAAFLLDQFGPAFLVNAGPGADLVLGPGAAALVAGTAAADARAAAADPYAALAAGADPQSLLPALAALGVTPLAAAPATGTVRVTVPKTTSRPFTVPANLRLVSAAGQAYAPAAAVTFVAPTAVATSGQVNLVNTPAGWVGAFAATAATPGAAGNLTGGANLTASTTVAAGAAYTVAVDFTGGRDAETAASVLARLPAAGSARTAATAAGVSQLILAALPGATVRVVGSGNAEQVRGRSALGVYLPGRVDARVRPAGAGLGSAVVRVQATLVSTAGGVGTWQLTTPTGNPAAPAYVAAVGRDGTTPPAGSGYAITSRGRGYDATAVPAGADVASVADAAFTVAGLCTCQFVDTDTPLAGLTVGASTQYYTAVVKYCQGVAAAQAAVGGTAAAAAGDCLARGPTPVRVLAAVTVKANAGVTVSTPAVQAAVAAAVNASGVVQSLTSGTVLGAALPAGVRMTFANITGTVFRGDGAEVNIGTGQVLDPGFVPTLGLGPDTLAYYCDPSDVSVTVT